MNKVILNGYLSIDPKQRITAKGIEQSSFSVGVTDLRNYAESYFFPCVAWGNQAKYINANLKKGTLVAIDGRLTRRSYVDNEGKTVYITEVVVDNIRSLNSRSTTNNFQNTNTSVNNYSQPTPSIEEIVVTNVDEVLNESSNSTPILSDDDKDLDWVDDLK